MTKSCEHTKISSCVQSPRRPSVPMMYDKYHQQNTMRSNPGFRSTPDAEEQSEKPSRSRNSTQNEIKGEKCIFKQPILPDDRNELYKNARDLLPEQRVVFDQFIHFVKSLVCFKNGGDIDAEPPRMIVHGKINYFYDSIF